MSYFHPWTLRKDDETEQAKYVGCLRPGGCTWQEAMQTWCALGTTCLESKRYLGNFLAVHRVRPQDEEDEGGHSSDMASDEELEVSSADLHAALQTRIGGSARAEDDQGDDIDEMAQKVSHHRNSAKGMNIAQRVWGGSSAGRSEPKFVQVGELKEVLQAARQSQRKEKSLSSSVKCALEKEASLQELSSATAEDVQTWLEKIKK